MARLTICEALDQLAESTGLELEQGVRTTQVLAEESVTDYNLMRLGACVASVIIEKHNKRREWKSGADWELWAGRSGAFVGFRIQAKILHHVSGRYESLYSSSKTLLTQIDKLIHSARNAPKTMYPLLTFYNYTSNPAATTCVPPCPRVTSNPSLTGWTVAGASAVRQRLLRDPSKHLSNLVDLMLPIPCLFCCPADCSRMAPRAPTLAESLSARVVAAWPDDAEPELGLRPGPGPTYVERLFKGEQADTGWSFLPSQIRRQFTQERALPHGISRAVIVREPPERA